MYPPNSLQLSALVITKRVISFLPWPALTLITVFVACRSLHPTSAGEGGKRQFSYLFDPDTDPCTGKAGCHIT